MTFQISHNVLLLGKPTEGFSETYVYEWDDGLGGGASQLFLNFRFDSDEFDGDELGRSIFEVVKNYFFHELDRDPGDRFEDVLKEVNHVVQQKEDEWGTSLLPKLHVLLVVITQGMMFLSQRGESEAYLIRKRYVSHLSDGLSDPKNKDELFANIASGGVTTDDVILLNSTRLLRYIPKSDLARLVSEASGLNEAMNVLSDEVSFNLTEPIHVLGIGVGEELEAAPVVVDNDEESGESVVSKRSLHLGKMASKLKLHLGRLVPSRDDTPAVEDEVDARRDQPLEEVQSSGKAMNDDVSSSSVPAPKGESRFRASFDWRHIFSEWRELKRDRILLALVVVVVALLVGIYMVRNQGQKQQLIEDLEAKLATVETNINEAQTIGSYDKDTAKILLDEAEELSLEVLNSGYLRGKASEYLEEIEKQHDSLDNVNRVSDPTVFVDLTEVDPEMNALGIVPLGSNLYVYEYNQLYELILDEVQDPVTIDTDEIVIDAVHHEENETLLFLTKSNRVIEYEDGQFSFVDTDDGAWHSAVDIQVYNSRIYLLDNNEGQIWRYYPQRGAYSGADEYVVDGSDLTDATSFAIDGAVYVMDASGEMTKYLSGEADDGFYITKPPTTDLSSSTKIYTEFEMFQVFILDMGENRVFEYSKDSRTGNLVYAGQYVFDIEEDIRDFYVDKDSNRLYLLTPTTIYEYTY